MVSKCVRPALQFFVSRSYLRSDSSGLAPADDAFGRRRGNLRDRRVVASILSIGLVAGRSGDPSCVGT
eukprot:7641523-Lingulodinium_polyedra.AAC.1